MTRAEYTAKYGTAPALPAPAPAPQDNGNPVGNFFKGLVSAPATMIARPFQALAGVGDYIGTSMAASGANPQAQSAIWKQSNDRQNLKNTQSSGPFGIVAPEPTNASDVVKDVGRGVQTVALGVGAEAPNAFTTLGGATNTLVSTLAGMGLGKALDLIGKPLLNAAGRVIGTITPKTLQDVVAKGSDAVSNFMEHHELLGGVAKPISNAITTGAEAIDTGTNKLFKSAGNAATDAFQSQYPGATKENVANHYQNTEVNRLMEPTKTPGSTFRNATEVATDASKRGIDLKQLAANNKIYASDHIVDGRFATQDTADALRNEAMNGGKDILRPALAEAEPGVQRVPISEVRSRILSKLSDVPDAKLSPSQKLSFAKKIAAEYGDGSVTSASHPDGYSLTNLYDSKLQTSSGLYKGPKNGGVQTISDNLTSQQKKIESQVFGDLLKKNAPKELGIDDYMKAQEGKFVLANYLESLNTKKAPQSLFQRGVRKAAQLTGATTGAEMAGPFGMFSGYQFGGVVADTFANVSNPVKVAYLKSIGKSEPEIYQIMRQFTSDAKTAADLRKALPASSAVDAGLSRAQNANGAIELNHPIHQVDKFGNDLTQNLNIANNTKRLPAPTATYQGPVQDGQPYTPNRLFSTSPVVETKSVRKKKAIF
jgi:hypothetical protein